MYVNNNVFFCVLSLFVPENIDFKIFLTQSSATSVWFLFKYSFIIVTLIKINMLIVHQLYRLYISIIVKKKIFLKHFQYLRWFLGKKNSKNVMHKLLLLVEIKMYFRIVI